MMQSIQQYVRLVRHVIDLFKHLGVWRNGKRSRLLTCQVMGSIPCAPTNFIAYEHSCFWLEDSEGRWTPYHKTFEQSELVQALEFCKSLRTETIIHVKHICISSELSDNVGLPGVSDPSPDYDWKKRR